MAYSRAIFSIQWSGLMLMVAPYQSDVDQDVPRKLYQQAIG
jgi:hypothetical protein